MFESLDNIITLILLFISYKALKKKLFQEEDNNTLAKFSEDKKNINKDLTIKYSAEDKYITLDKKQKKLYIPTHLSNSNFTFYKYITVTKILESKTNNFVAILNNFLLKHYQYILWFIVIIITPTYFDIYFPSVFYILYGILLIYSILTILYNLFFFEKKIKKLWEENISEIKPHRINLFCAINLLPLFIIFAPAYIINLMIKLFNPDSTES